MSKKEESGMAHDKSTLELAKEEYVSHMRGMAELYDTMRQRPLRIKAYALNSTEAPTFAKTVHFVRHGQGFHNLMGDLARQQNRQWEEHSTSPKNPYVMPEILDAPLTQKGRDQARSLQRVTKTLDPQPELIVLSPLCRALQTGVIAFEHLLDNPPTRDEEKVPFLVHEMVREENGVHVCDQRRPTSHSSKEFPMVDFSLVETEDDVLFYKERRETKAEVGERVYKFLEWLEKRNESVIGVATHSGWLLTLFNGVCQCVGSDAELKFLKDWFQTGEMRSVTLIFERH